MKQAKLTLTPLRSALLAGEENELDVLIRVTAPCDEQSKSRTSLNLSLVIDRSGSMSGQPLDEAKNCARFIVDSLSPQDTLSLVAYDNCVDVLVENCKVGDRVHLHQMINSIFARGTTALHDGWLEGTGQAAKSIHKDVVSRVLLLSDGMANAGLTDVEAISQHCAEMAEAGVTTSTYGLSHRFNEELMVEMARSGLGNSYYGETADDLMDPFREEFDLLRALYARNLRLSLNPVENIDMTVLNDYQRDRNGAWILPDLALCGQAWALARLRIPQHLASRPQGEIMQLLNTSIEYDEVEGEQVAVTSRLELPVLGTEAYAVIPSEPYVDERAKELRFAQIQREARNAARSHDWDGVQRLLSDAEHEAQDNPWLQEGLNTLRRYARQRHVQRFSKEAHYSSRKMASRLVDPNERPGEYDMHEESTKAAFLRRKREQGKRFDRD